MRNFFINSFLSLLALLVLIAPESSHAAAAGGGVPIVETAICNVVGALQGPIAKGVAAFGIIFLGFSLFLGKISWGTGIALAIGLGAVLGAGEIVDLIAGAGGGAQGCGTAP